MVFAPVLQEVAARISGSGSELLRERPDKWAYALREAVSLVNPDWVVTHYDLDLEAEAVASEADAIDDVADVRLEQSAPASAALQLTQTLAGLYPAGVVAASITGPASMATRPAFAQMCEGGSESDLVELLDLCGDALAEFAAAHVERGAQRLIVWEADPSGYDADDVAASQAPILRRLETLGVPVILASAAALGDGVVLIPVDSLSLESAGADEVVLTDGPIPASCEMSVLRRLGERERTPA